MGHASLFLGEPVELILDLRPTSNLFDQGHRIRVNVTCGDSGDFDMPIRTPPANGICLSERQTYLLDGITYHTVGQELRRDADVKLR